MTEEVLIKNEIKQIVDSTDGYLINIIIENIVHFPFNLIDCMNILLEP